MTAALYLPSLNLSPDEQEAFSLLRAKLLHHQSGNENKADYYEAKTRMDSLGIAIPPSLEGLDCAIGWPSVAVDTIEERLDFERWTGQSEDVFGLDDVYQANDLDVEAPIAHLDALIYGTAFAAVGRGVDGGPDPLVTVESPRYMTAIINPRTRQVRYALRLIEEDSEDRVLGRVREVGATLYMPGVTITLDGTDNNWVVVDRDQHNLDRIPVAQLINRPRSGARQGRSEITPVVRSLTQTGMRTLAAAEIAREYHAAPQRYVLGAKESFFVDPDGNPLSSWKSYLGRLLALERDENGEVPDIKEFAGASLESFFGMMRMLTQLMSSEIAVPSNYLGFTTDNPPSAEAINAMEARLVKRAERRQRMFGRAWTEVGRLAILVRDGSLPKEAVSIRPDWRDASTPTKAASSDAVAKLVAAGILSPQSRVTWDLIGLSPEQQEQLESEKRKQTVTDLVTGLRANAAVAQQDPQVAQLANQTTAAPGQDSAPVVGSQ